MLKSDFELHDKIFCRQNLYRFIISNKLITRGYFEFHIKDAYHQYWQYVSNYNIVGQSLSKNIESFFNLILLRDYEPYCYQIEDLDKTTLIDYINQYYEHYKQKTKYSSLNGFKENDFNYVMLKQRIEYVKNQIDKNQIKQVDKLKNRLNIFDNTQTPLITFYSSYLNIIEISEYLNNIYDDVTNFNPDNETDIKHPFKDPETYDLFNYLVDNWDYKPDIKWAYIYNFFDDPKIYQNEYERYVKETQNFKGLFKYNNANSKKVYDTLNQLKKSFIKNYQ